METNWPINNYVHLYLPVWKVRWKPLSEGEAWDESRYLDSSQDLSGWNLELTTPSGSSSPNFGGKNLQLGPFNKEWDGGWWFSRAPERICDCFAYQCTNDELHSKPVLQGSSHFLQCRVATDGFLVVNLGYAITSYISNTIFEHTKLRTTLKLNCK